MFHRFFLGRLLILLLLAGLLFGGASGLYRAGYRQGFVQGATLAATDGQAVTPPAAYWAAGGWGHGPGPLPLIGLAFLGFFALMARGGRRRHAAHHWGGPGREKQPQEYV